MEQTQEPKKNTRAWLKRLGWAGFAFFLIKGILWLTLGATVIKGCF
jgi:hypothetical protein